MKRQPKTAQEILWLATSESDLQATVVELLERHHWRVFTVRRSAYAGKNGRAVSAVTSTGWPDVVAIHPGSIVGCNILAFECKTMKGKVTPEQEEWLAAWSAVGAWSATVRPSDVDSIIAMVQGGAA